MRTLVFAYGFALYAYVQPFGYRHAYPTRAERASFAHAFSGNVGLRLFYGRPHDVVSVDGYTAWRVGGTLAVAAGFYGLLAAVRAWRADEEAGQAELLLAGPINRRTLDGAALLAIAGGTLTLWVAEFAGFAVAGLGFGGAAYLALATAAVIPVCAGVGAIAAQLASTRRFALELGAAGIALLFLLRAVADTTSGFGWVRWLTPLGWAEELRPFAGPRPLVLLLFAAASLLLLGTATRLGANRDIGSGILPSRERAEPRLRLLRTPVLQALRINSGTVLSWVVGVAVFGFVLGIVSKSISPADISKSMQAQIAKLGAGSITTPAGYLAFVFIFVVLGVALFACAQVSATRQEEAEQQLQTLLALPIGRERWLAGRVVLAAAAAATLSLTAGFSAWAGATTGGAQISLPRFLAAGANALPTAVLFLGLAALAYALVPRASAAIAYAIVCVAFLSQLVGAVAGAPHWLLQVTPFAHVALLPVQPFRAGAAAAMVALGAVCTVAALRAFRHRDLVAG